MKRFKETVFLITTLLFVSFFSACDVYSYVPSSNLVNYDNPTWAPPYTPGVRYYYFPDIECYYDLSAQEFVYLDNGQWIFSPNLPDIYSNYDLSNSFTVAINYNTYQPWMHHQYYVSHYPMYYYRDYYDHSNIPYVRGFNENNRSAVYWSQSERNHARNWDNENMKTNHQFQYSAPDRQHQSNSSRASDFNNTPQVPANRTDNRQQPNMGNNKPTPVVPPGSVNPTRQDGNDKNNKVMPPRISGFESGARQQKEITPVRPNQNTNYYGRTIGQPVRVQKQMRQPSPTPSDNRNNQNSGNNKEGERK